MYGGIVRRFADLGVNPRDVLIINEIPLEKWGIRGGQSVADVGLGFSLDVQLLDHAPPTSAACENRSVDVNAYLARIGVTAPVELTLVGLERLQRAHLTAVPFENLDVFYRRGVSTEPSWSVSKIVERGRGGWCYELNGAFASLLEELGFEVRWLGAGVLPVTGPMPDHMAIEVMLDQAYLVDVGFGDSFIRPLPIESKGPHDGGSGMYRFEIEGDMTTLVSEKSEGPTRDYEFDRSAEFTAEDFEPSSHRLQTESGLRWTESPLATRLLDGGPDRVTLLKDRIKIRRNGATTEEPVGPGEWDGALFQWFGMEP